MPDHAVGADGFDARPLDGLKHLTRPAPEPGASFAMNGFIVAGRGQRQTVGPAANDGDLACCRDARRLRQTHELAFDGGLLRAVSNLNDRASPAMAADGQADGTFQGITRRFAGASVAAVVMIRPACFL